jgi:ATP-dependent protease ClpP protease subunit
MESGVYIIPIIGVIGQDFKYTDLLSHLNAAKDYQSIKLIFDSAGGDLIEGLKMRDALVQSKKTIFAVNSGDVASIAVSLFLTAEKENRFFNPVKGQFLIHNPYIDPKEMDVMLDSKNLDFISEEMKNYERVLLKQYSKGTGSDENVLKAFMNENAPLTEDQIKDLGFAKIEVPEFKAVAFINKSNNMKKEDIQKNLSAIEKMLNGIKALFNPKALMVQDVNGVELDIAVETPDQIVEGVTATVAGSPAEGDFVIDGKAYTFKGGVLESISEPTDDAEALKKENEELKAQVATLTQDKVNSDLVLKALKDETASQVKKVADEFLKFKNQFSKEIPSVSVTPPAGTPPEVSRKAFKSK